VFIYRRQERERGGEMEEMEWLQGWSDKNQKEK
jgi:hypothetical protein